MKYLIKICGLASAADTAATLALQPDAVGFIFYAKSPRAVTPEQVRDWTRDRMPAGTRKVGVFVDASAEELKRSAEIAGLDVLQLHGSETPAFAQSLSYPLWKALHLDRLPADWEDYPVEHLLIDSGTVEMPGGSGIQVETARAAEFVEKSRQPVLLAGGLKAGTVGAAIQQVRPAGVDVSTGVERRPGEKDMQAVRDFICNAREAFLTLD